MEVKKDLSYNHLNRPIFRLAVRFKITGHFGDQMTIYYFLPF